MTIKSPVAPEVELEFDGEACSKTLPDEKGVLSTGYNAVCPKTGKQFEVKVTISGVGTDKESAVIETASLSMAAELANKRNAVADEARKAATVKAEADAVEAVDRLAGVAQAVGLTLSDQMKTKLYRTAVAQKLDEAIADTMAAHDESIGLELVEKAVADKALAEAAIARASG